jgi:hypothetical protein
MLLYSLFFSRRHFVNLVTAFSNRHRRRCSRRDLGPRSQRVCLSGRSVGRENGDSGDDIVGVYLCLCVKVVGRGVELEIFIKQFFGSYSSSTSSVVVMCLSSGSSGNLM